MAMITAMSTRGQIVLPKKIRTALNLGAGTQFIVFSDDENILLKPIKTPAISEFDSLLAKARQWAVESGLQESDIDEAIKAVRKKSMKRSVIDTNAVASATSFENEPAAEDAVTAMRMLSAISQANGNSQMTLDEINAEIHNK